MAGFSGPVGFGNLGRPGGPTRLGPVPGFRQGGPIGFGNLGRPGGPTRLVRPAGPSPSNAALYAAGWLRNAQGQPTAPNGGAANSVAPGQSQTGAPGQTSSQPSPLDATFWNNVANEQAKVNGQINGLNLNSGLANTALQSALAQLAYQQPRSELALEEKANARGGLFSSVYNQQLGDLNYQFAGKQGGLIDKYGGQQMSDAAKIAALQQGMGAYDQGQALLAAERQTALAAKNPAVGSGVSSGGNPAGAAQQTVRSTGNGSGVATGGETRAGRVPPVNQRILNANARRAAHAGFGAPKGNRFMAAARRSFSGGF